MSQSLSCGLSADDLPKKCLYLKKNPQTFADNSLVSETLGHQSAWQICLPVGPIVSHDTPTTFTCRVLSPRIVQWKLLPAGSCCSELSGNKDISLEYWHVTESWYQAMLDSPAQTVFNLKIRSVWTKLVAPINMIFCHSRVREKNMAH